MISPINFRATAGNVVMTKPVETDAPKTETVTAPVETAATFKGANALAAYNKAFLAAEPATEETPKAPAFRGEEVETEETPKAPAFKGEEVESVDVPKTPAFKGEESEETKTEKA